MNNGHTNNYLPVFAQGEHDRQLDTSWSDDVFTNNMELFPTMQPTDIRLTPENLLINNKEECDLIEGQLFQDFNQVGKVEYQESNSNSSDKSSPTGILNNIPLTTNDINTLNNSLINQSNLYEAGLSQKEIATRRKVQNRAAQRAFRERKELKLKELEEKLNQSESDKAQLMKQLEDIKKQNIVISTENKLLLQNGTAPIAQDQQPIAPQGSSFSFPVSDNVKESKYFLEPSQLSNSQIPYEYKRLTITEVWDYLNENYDEDLKIDEVMVKIKGLEVCHQHGPAYPLKTVDEIARSM